MGVYDMPLVKNWRAIAARSYSMWALYLSFFCLIAPDAIYLIFWIDTSPRLWWALGVVLLLYGIWGRLKDQGIDRTKTQSPWMVGVVALVALGAIYSGDWRDRAGGATGLDLVSVVAGDSAALAPSRPGAALPVVEAEFMRHAVPFIGRWEGLRLSAYRDIVGVLTVCYGETKGVRAGDTYTRPECDAMFARELIAYRNGVHAGITPEARAASLAPLRDVAFVDLAYNVGVSGAVNSTAVRRLNAGNIEGACEALTWWNKAGGRVIRGLVNRRAAAFDLCIAGWA
jgi:lysozyme